IINALKAGISVYVMHTNYDSATNGINDILASTLDLQNTSILFPRRDNTLYKICVFVPNQSIDVVRNSMAENGAGIIGEYSYCSFRSLGIGSFLGSESSNPTIGEKSKLEEVEEYKLEMVCHKSKLEQVISGMIAAHPYEEPAYDVIELYNGASQYGYGRVGNLKREMLLSEFTDMVQQNLNVEYIKVKGNDNKLIKKVAVCGGSGSSLYTSAIANKADVFVTGDTKYHDMVSADFNGLAMIDAGHFETEKPGMLSLCSKLQAEFENKINISYIE
ncbi:MAG: Nif3-like dinuclear metal center hexameric protein, partial [Armatimonadota bacterium]